MIRAFTFAATSALLLLVGTAASAAPDGKNRKVTVENLSSQTIRELYASPITATVWEEDLLGERTLTSGQSIVANIDNGTDQCYFDLKAVKADGTAVEQRSINVCAVTRWSIGDAGNSVS
ncbi:MAG TPA: hypothetical protein VHG29_10330 [Novosphingobium sp.]|nr:hypothetical protein [Novosphingobium sp.]